MASSASWGVDHLLTGTGTYGTSGRPALAVFNNKVYCVHEGRNDSGWLWCTVFDGTAWSEDQLLPNSASAFGTSGPPALVVFPDNGTLYCVREGRNDSGWLWCASTSDGINWSQDALLPNRDNAFGTSGSPALAAFKGRLYCAREGRGDSGWVWCASTSDGVHWSEDALLPNGDNAFGTSGPPALVEFNNELYCLRQSRDGGGWLWGASTADGVNWSTDAPVPNPSNAIGLSSSPAMAVFRDTLYCIHEGRNDSGWLWCSATTDGVNWSQDALVPNSQHAIGTSGAPGLCVYQAPDSDTDSLLCVHEGRNDGGWLWISELSSGWMEKYYGKLKDKKLIELCLPASHDSGAYDLKDEIIPSQVDSAAILTLWNSNLPGVRDGIRDFSKTQSVSISEQLAGGIRYLDFRIAQRSNGNYCLSHSVVGPDLKDVLNDIKAFLDANTQEIIVVESTWVGDGQQSGYLSLVQDIIGSYYTAVSPGLLNKTLGQLVDSGNRFIFCDGRRCINTSSYAAKQSADEILVALKDNWNKGPFANQLWQVSFCARPKDETYIIGVAAGLSSAELVGAGALLQMVFQFLPSVATALGFELWVAVNKPPTSLRDVAHKLVSDNLITDYLAWVEQQQTPKALNCLIADFFEETGIVDFAIQRSIAAPASVRPQPA